MGKSFHLTNVLRILAFKSTTKCNQKQYEINYTSEVNKVYENSVKK